MAIRFIISSSSFFCCDGPGSPVAHGSSPKPCVSEYTTSSLTILPVILNDPPSSSRMPHHVLPNDPTPSSRTTHRRHLECPTTSSRMPHNVIPNDPPSSSRMTHNVILNDAPRHPELVSGSLSNHPVHPEPILFLCLQLSGRHVCVRMHYTT